MLRTSSLDGNRRVQVWATVLIASTVITIPVAGAEEPGIVYQKSLTEFGTLQPHDIMVDDAGLAYVLAARPGSNYATLVLKLDSEGAVLWSQWFDGSSHDIPGGIALGPAGDVYVVGTTGSADFPLLNPLQATPSSVQYEPRRAGQRSASTARRP